MNLAKILKIGTLFRTVLRVGCIVYTHTKYTLLELKENYILPASLFYFRGIARGTTDPEIDSVTWTKFGNNMAPLALVAILATRWRHLH